MTFYCCVGGGREGQEVQGAVGVGCRAHLRVRTPARESVNQPGLAAWRDAGCPGRSEVQTHAQSQLICARCRAAVQHRMAPKGKMAQIYGKSPPPLERVGGAGPDPEAEMNLDAHPPTPDGGGAAPNREHDA